MSSLFTNTVFTGIILPTKENAVFVSVQPLGENSSSAHSILNCFLNVITNYIFSAQRPTLKMMSYDNEITIT